MTCTAVPASGKITAMIRKSLLVLLAAALMPAAIASAAGDKPKSATQADSAAKVVARVQQFYESMPAYSADFEQTTFLAATNRAIESRGKVSFKKPGMMRFDYTTPEQLIVSNGKTAWHYQPEDKQVTVYSTTGFLGNYSASIAFLGGTGKLTNEFNVAIGKRPDGALKEGEVLELTPKGETSVLRRLVLIVDPAKGNVLESWVYPLASVAPVRMRFVKPDFNPPLTADDFSFTPPKGVDVIQAPAF